MKIMVQKNHLGGWKRVRAGFIGTLIVWIEWGTSIPAHVKTICLTQMISVPVQIIF